MDNKKSIDKIFKEGQSALKTSFFTFKFNPDYLSAVTYFTDAAEEYKNAKYYDESLMAYQQAIKCNKELMEGWAEGTNWQHMADIYLFDKNDFKTGWNCLQNASMCFKVSGKFSVGIRVYTDTAQKLIELQQRHQQAAIVLKKAYEDCLDYTHDDLIRISLENAYNQLLDLYCYLSNYVDAIYLVENYLKTQKLMKDEPKHKISRNYVKYGMLRIIINEAYMVNEIVSDMFSYYDSSCSDDIDDLKKLAKSFETCNKKDFNRLMTYTFSVYPNNMLKALKEAYESKESQQSNLSSQPVEELNNINVKEISSNDTGNETKAETEFKEPVESSNADEYL